VLYRWGGEDPVPLPPLNNKEKIEKVENTEPEVDTNNQPEVETEIQETETEPTTETTEVQDTEEQQDVAEKLEQIEISNTGTPTKQREKYGVQAEKAKVIYIYRNGDKHHKGEKFTINKKNFKTFDQLLQGMTKSVKLVTGAVRKIVTIDGVPAKSFDDIIDGGQYICCAAEPLNKENLPLVLRK